MKRLLLRVIGIRVVESPEALRVTLPRWMGEKMHKKIMDKIEHNLSSDRPALAVRRTGRSLIVKL